MYRELLIDHTSLHSLRKRPLTNEALPGAARQLFQVIENILLADRVWMTNSVTEATRHETSTILENCYRHGLTDARNSKKIQMATFSLQHMRLDCEAAAARVFECVQNLTLSELDSLSSTRGYNVQPFGAQGIDYAPIESLTFGSQEAGHSVERAFRELGWAPVSVLPLLNVDLWEWFQLQMSQQPTSRSLQVFSTICRWRINVAMAERLSDSHGHVDYAPAYGRIAMIDNLSDLSLMSRLQAFEQNVNKATHDLRHYRPYLDLLAPAVNFPLPLIGLWVVQMLPETCTIDHLYESLSRLQTDSKIERLKEWIQNSDQASQTKVLKEIAGELASTQKGRASRSTARIKLEGKLKISLPFVEMSLKSERDATFSPAKCLTQIRRYLTLHPTATLLTGYIEDSARESVNSSLEKVRRLLS